MKILGIDTSTKYLCIGIYDHAKIYEYNLEVGTKLSSLLGVAIARVVQALGWQMRDIDYFACGLGPGSFTGMRVGLSTVKGLSWSLKRPIIGISSLDILAQNASSASGKIVTIVDAKRNLIYCSVYKKKNKQLVRVAPYMLLTEKEFFKKFKSNVTVNGDAVGLHREKILMNIKRATLLGKDYWYPNGRNIIELALERIKDKKLDSSFDIKPIYLYPKECQVRKI